jgi:MFS family permease
MSSFRKSIPRAYLSQSYNTTARSSVSTHHQVYRLTNPLDAGTATPRTYSLQTLNPKPSQNFSLFSDTDKKEDHAPHEEDEESLVPTPPRVNDASSIPNGGLRAWLQVLSSFFLMFNSWGIINTFGVYQAYYESNLLKTSTSSAISWIGSIQAFLLLIVGMLTGPLYDAGYFRHLLVFGSVMLVLGMMMLSLCREYWQVLLAQAVCVGVGTGALFVPSIAILSTYFSTRIGLAIGIAASGSSLGGVIYPIVFQQVLPKLGFAWTTRVLGLILGVTMVVPNVCMKVRVLPAKSRSLIDLSAFKIPAYSLQTVGFFFGFMGLYIPFFYAQVFAVQEHITSEEMAFYLLAIMNGTSVFGRKSRFPCLPHSFILSINVGIIPNLFADKLGPFNVVLPCCLISCVLCLCFITIKSSTSIIILMAFYGFFSGSFVSLPPTIVVGLSADARDKIGTRLGQAFACVAFGLLIGTPIGGVVVEKGGFKALWGFGGALLGFSGVLLITARVSWAGWTVLKKA